MTPPCPNCGTIYHEGRDVRGRLLVSIVATVLYQEVDGAMFCGTEYRCTRCYKRWRVPLHSVPASLPPLP